MSALRGWKHVQIQLVIDTLGVKLGELVSVKDYYRCIAQNR